jgi:uncharacterized protein involved in outer membrane biogenesis
MKSLFKWTFRIVALLVLAVILLLVFKDSIMRSIVEHRIREETGMEAKIGRFSCGILSPVVTIENLKLYNTAEFGGTEFLIVPELHMELDAEAIQQQKVRIKLIRLNLAELDVVRNQAGQTNLVTMLSSLPKGKLAPHGIHVGGRKFEFEGIDTLNLSLGRMRFLDLKHPEQNYDQQINLDNQVFSNIKTDGDIGGVAVTLFLRMGGASVFRPKSLLNQYLNPNISHPRPQLERTSPPPKR